jgi:hypothetical protein
MRALAFALVVGAGAVAAARPADTQAVQWVKGAVKLRLSTLAADVEVTAGADKQVTVKVSEGDVGHVSFRQDGGERLEVLFDGVPALRCGKVCVAVPPRSAVDVTTASGDVQVRGTDGEVRLRSAAGDLHVTRAGSLEIRSVSGDVGVEQVAGEARIETVSGDASVTNAPRVRFATTSGDLLWTGTCGDGCELAARTLSGDITLQLNPASSFGLHYTSHSGDLLDELGLAHSGTRAPPETNLRSHLGAGDGLIECETFSGDLRLARRR